MRGPTGWRRALPTWMRKGERAVAIGAIEEGREREREREREQNACREYRMQCNAMRVIVPCLALPRSIHEAPSFKRRALSCHSRPWRPAFRAFPTPHRREHRDFGLVLAWRTLLA